MLLAFYYVVFFVACKKAEKIFPEEKIVPGDSTSTRGFRTLLSSCQAYSIIDSMLAYNTDADSTEIPTILGNHRTNPYTIANMQQAYANLGLTGITVGVTNLYVRFLPSSVDQLAILDSTLDVQGLEMFDTPVDYDVLQEGDYYQDPSIPDSSITWQYAVVPPSFQFPSGITYQILSQIHIPADDYTAVETEAERLASIQDSINCSNGGARISPNSAEECDPGYYWDPILRRCVKNDPPPAPNPPPPAPDAQVPAGNITVSDINLGNTPNVRNVRVVAKRWFKIERSYTDNNGNFQFTKHFKHKVKIRVKFKNDYSTIKVFRVTKFWQMLYPVARTIGVFSSDKNNIHYNFFKYNTSVADIGNLYWAAATTINSVQEYRDYAAQENFGVPPMHLKIFLTRWAHGAGMTPMFNKRWYSGLPQEVALTFFVSAIYWPAAIPTAFLETLKHEVDMAISYRGPFDDYSTFYPDDLKTTTYHELTHAAHYEALGGSWYTTFVDAEITEVSNNLFSPQYSPYGSGSNSVTSPIIALGESWAYHMGQYLANLRYGMTSSDAGEQGIDYSNNDITGLNSHQIALENYNPNLSSYAFHWIPKGLYYDLMDIRNEASPVVDQVSGYTNSQFFGAFSSSIETLQDFKQNLLQQSNNNQSTQVLNLFQQYGY